MKRAISTPFLILIYRLYVKSRVDQLVEAQHTLEPILIKANENLVAIW